MQTITMKAPPLPHYITSGDFVYKKGQAHFKRRNFPVFDLLVVTKGTLYMIEEEQEFEVRENHALILLPERYHSGSKPCDEETTYYWVHFQTEGSWVVTEESVTADGHNQPLPIPDSQTMDRPFHVNIPQFVHLSQPEPVFERLQRLNTLNHGLHMQQIRWQQQLVLQELLQLLAAAATGASEHGNTSQHCAELAASYLRKHYQQEITATQLGVDINFHPVYIARCMQRQFGCTPVEYLQRYRIEQAKNLLTQTNVPISRIAEEVGFNQSAYFTSCFSRYVGESPSVYRKRYR